MDVRSGWLCALGCVVFGCAEQGAPLAEGPAIAAAEERATCHALSISVPKPGSEVEVPIDTRFCEKDDDNAVESRDITVGEFTFRIEANGHVKAEYEMKANLTDCG